MPPVITLWCPFAVPIQLSVILPLATTTSFDPKITVRDGDLFLFLIGGIFVLQIVLLLRAWLHQPLRVISSNHSPWGRLPSQISHG